MRKSKILFIVFLFIIPFFKLAAESGIEIHTDLKTGDTIPCYSDTYASFRIYAFIGDQNCFVCMQSLVNVCDYLFKHGKTVEIILFSESKSKNSIANFKENFKWKYPAVDDPVGAYKQLYKVKQFPLFILTNSKGVVYYLGVPGTNGLFEWDDIKAALKKMKEAQKDDLSIKHLQFIKKTDLLDSNGGKISDMDVTQCYINEKSHNLVTFNSRNNTLAEFNINGKKLHELTLQLPDHFLQYWSLICNNKGNDNVYCQGTDIINKLTFIVKVNFKANILEQIFVCNDSDAVNKNYYNNYEGFYCLGKDVFIATQTKYDYTIDNKEPLLRIYSFKGEEYNKLGYFDPIYFKTNYFHFCYTVVATDNDNNIFALQNLTNKLFLYNKNGEKLTEIKCRFDSTYYFYDYPNEFKKYDTCTDSEPLKQLSFILTSFNKLLFDNVNNKIYVVYLKVNAENYKLKYFIHSPQDAVEGKNSTDIALPVNCFPVQIDNGILSVLRKIDGFYCIVQYSSDVWK